MSYQLQEGQSYTIGIAATNSSTQSGQPVAATLRVAVSAGAGSTVILATQEQSHAFAAGESYKFSFPMTVPAGTGGQSGTIKASLLDPSGNQLQQASADIQIAPQYYRVPVGPITISRLNGYPLKQIVRNGVVVGYGPSQPLIYSGVGSDTPSSLTYTVNTDLPITQLPFISWALQYYTRYTPDGDALGHYRAYGPTGLAGTTGTVGYFSPFAAGGPGTPAGIYDLVLDVGAVYSNVNGGPFDAYWLPSGEVILYDALQVK